MEYADKELEKIDAERKKEILKEKIIKIEYNEEKCENRKLISLNEDSDMRKHEENKKIKMTKNKDKCQENEGKKIIQNLTRRQKELMNFVNNKFKDF